MFNYSDYFKLWEIFVDSTFVFVKLSSNVLFSRMFPDEFPNYAKSSSSSFDKLVFNFYSFSNNSDFFFSSSGLS